MRRWTESHFALSWVANSILAVHGHDAKHWPFSVVFFIIRLASKRRQLFPPDDAGGRDGPRP
jgi:hypothetical protein